MRRLRHHIFQRVLALGLLGSLALGLAAPATGAATQRALEAETARVPAAVAAAAAEALGQAAQTALGPAQFQQAFEAALAAQPDGEALARFMNEHGAAEALLTLLYEHLLRALHPRNGLQAVPATPLATGTVGLTSPAAGGCAPSAVPDETYRGQLVRSDERQVVIPLAVLSAAQPLGP